MGRRAVCKSVISEKRELFFLFFLLMLIYNELKITGLTFAENYFQANVGKCLLCVVTQRK